MLAQQGQGRPRFPRGRRPFGRGRDQDGDIYRQLGNRSVPPHPPPNLLRANYSHWRDIGATDTILN